MFNSIKSGLKVIKTGKDIKKAIETVPNVRDSSAEFYNKMILAVENNYISDEEVEVLGEAFKKFVRNSSTVITQLVLLTRFVVEKLK